MVDRRLAFPQVVDDQGLSPADARFLMLTAITHHRFSSPV